MKRCAIQQNAMSGCEEVKRNSISVSDRMDSLVCPKPRRLGVASPSINDHFRSLRYHVRYPRFIRFTERVGKRNYIEFTVMLTIGSFFFFFLFDINSHQTEICESKAGTELLDIILSKVLLFTCSFREALYLLLIDSLLLCNKFLYFLVHFSLYGILYFLS